MFSEFALYFEAGAYQPVDLTGVGRRLRGLSTPTPFHNPVG